jgi:hypothetical protein
MDNIICVTKIKMLMHINFWNDLMADIPFIIIIILYFIKDNFS